MIVPSIRERAHRASLASGANWPWDDMMFEAELRSLALAVLEEAIMVADLHPFDSWASGKLRRLKAEYEKEGRKE